MNKYRIATWNLDHASNSSRSVALQIEQILLINPDIIVLTETCEDVDLSKHGYCGAKTHKNSYGKYYSAIWSKMSIETVFPTYDNITAVCTKLRTDSGCIIIYGTIITYADGKGIDGKSKRWEEHYKAIEIQGNEWNRLIEAHPDCVFLVAGDFNQTRDGSKQTYGTRYGRDLMSIQLNKNNLVCLTEDNFGELGKLTPDPKTGWFRNNIDHICISKNDFELISADAWNHFTNDGIYMSDHNGVFVDIVLHPQNK